MTWTITPSEIDRWPVVKWNDKRLCLLSDEDFEAAVIAANALGEVVCMDATEVKPGLAGEAYRADVIVVSVMREMQRREVEAVKRPEQDDDTDLDESRRE
jgi:hypothetical protein